MFFARGVSFRLLLRLRHEELLSEPPHVADLYACSGDCEETTPSCGCDGKVYSSPCAAHQAGVDVGPACDSSLTPTGLIPCGAIYCDPQTTYCLRGDGDAADHIYRCIDLPAACGASPDCDCIDRPHDACEIVSGNGVMGIAVDVDCLLQGC